MSGIYWIYILANISNFCTIVQIIAILAMIFLYVSYIIYYLDDNITNKHKRIFYKNIKIFTIAFCVSSTICIAIPTKKDMLLMYGLGQTMEYFKSNEAAKQLPDKCIKAINAFADEYIEKSNKEE